MVPNVSFDALVVLGCRVERTGLSGAAQRRVERAARAFLEEGAALVIASGGRSWSDVKECEAFAQGLIERGVPGELILQERRSLTTHGNARGVRELLGTRKAQKLGIVTCDFHMPRALWLFRRLGMPATAVPAPSPPPSRRVAAARYVREHGSLALSWALSWRNP
jgi:uncharacterized SAM-binding protein YcdF (DUF218 family)